MASPLAPILLLGAGRMGGALVAGWLGAAAFAPGDILLRDPDPGAQARAAVAAGARLNPPDADLAAARTVILAVKPQSWREPAYAVAPHLAPDAVIVSLMAGIGTEAIAAAFRGREVARAMPTTAAGIGQGTTSVFARAPATRARVRALFAPVGAVIDLDTESLMHAATAVSGSGPAYLYAFIEALGSAGAAIGLDPGAARELARSTTTGAAALLAAGSDPPEALRRQVTSPGGTTEAALNVLLADGALEGLLSRAVAAAAARSRELGG